MKRVAMLAAVVGLLLLDWAALHDVLGGEPDVRMEWAILGLSLLAYMLLWKALALRRSSQG